MRVNHDYYKDPTAHEAIRRASKGKKRIKPWGDRLTYRIGEVMEFELIHCIML